MRKEEDDQKNDSIIENLNQITILPNIDEENVTQRKRKKNNSISAAALKRPKSNSLFLI